MLSHIPDCIELVDYIDDGEQARHYLFRLLNLAHSKNKNHPHHWQQVQPGQFFMLNVPSIGEAPFTFTEPPNERGEFKAFIRQMGQVTSTLFSMQRGAILGARGPFGRGWPLDKIVNHNTLIIAGGCGLAPLVTLIDKLTNNSPDKPTDKLADKLANKAKNKQQLILVYGARNRAAQMLTPERARWQKQIKIFNTLDATDEYTSTNANTRANTRANNSNELRATTVQGSPLMILPTALSTFTRPPTTALLCGPELMMSSAATYLTEHGMTSDAIFLAVERRMHCALGLCGHCYIKHQYVCKSGPTFSWHDFQQLKAD
ncbi:FAD-binding oxidoreductase [Colwellia sp. MB3u-4]|uniref:iron-sulfur cluster-binding protein n=1 Tax=Colwellia sp. MB3u-4 TaxID=2759822 RepID=UPI0015F5EB83|nr:FAD-binding oxidoreductase [Colwellia sp. MB3u-4]MBA6289360.1 oxidoreductase [Colwellia sp. MB3u-4]